MHTVVAEFGYDMSRAPSNRRPLMIGGGIVAFAIVAYLAFGVFAVQTLFIDEEVAEAAPTFTVAAETPTSDDELTSTEGSDANTGATTTAVEPAEIVPEIAVSGAFVDGDHPTSGTAIVLTDGALQRVLRFEEDFATDNGPDLNVYLAPSSDVDGEFIDLGDMKGNLGSQNYEIPVDVDLETYDTVVIWCVRFGVAFGSAELAAS